MESTFYNYYLADTNLVARVLYKVDASQLGKGSSCVLANQYFTQLWHDDIFSLFIAVITALQANSEFLILNYHTPSP